MAKKAYNLEQTGDQVQAALNKVINLVPATEEAAGLMSAADKEKLNGLPTGANIQSSLGEKVDKVTGKGLSTNDYDDSDKSKVASAYQKPNTGIPKEDLSDGVKASLGNADSASQDVADIKTKIPSQATAQNKLADKDFVNSSIATATADFKGTYDSLSELQAVTADKNDYGYVVSTDQAGNTVYSRYKYDGSAWVFEYDLNNSSFTAAEWASIQSQITSALVQKLSALPTNQELSQSLSGKQDTISDLATIRSGAAAGATAYQKPAAGIPKTDLNAAVNLSIERAEEANVRPYDSQSPNGMGYLVLEKDKTFASQVTAANTIYEIRYLFTVSGTFAVPTGAKFKFNGGKIDGVLSGLTQDINPNDFSTFQNAVDSAMASGRAIVIDGLYETATGATITDGISIIGADKYKSVIKMTGNAPLITVSKQTGTFTHLFISNLTFDGGTYAIYRNESINSGESASMVRCTVADVLFKKQSAGAIYLKGYGVGCSKFENLEFDNNYVLSSDRYVHIEVSWFNENSFDGCKWVSQKGNGAVYIKSETEFFENHFTKCYSELMQIETGYACFEIDAAYCRNLFITDGYFERIMDKSEQLGTINLFKFVQRNTWRSISLSRNCFVNRFLNIAVFEATGSGELKTLQFNTNSSDRTDQTVSFSGLAQHAEVESLNMSGTITFSGLSTTPTAGYLPTGTPLTTRIFRRKYLASGGSTAEIVLPESGVFQVVLLGIYNNNNRYVYREYTIVNQPDDTLGYDKIEIIEVASKLVDRVNPSTTETPNDLLTLSVVDKNKLYMTSGTKNLYINYSLEKKCNIGSW